jgi:acyl carrier protein
MERTAMLDKAVPTRRERVAVLVQERLARRGIAKPVTGDDDLRDSGISSLDMVNLMLAVEAEFALTIPEADMTPANFRSVAAIEALVASLQGAA